MDQMRQLFATDSLREALDLLLSKTSDPGLRAELTNLSSQLAQQERDALLRIQNTETLDVRRNQLRAAILSLAERTEHSKTVISKDGSKLKKRAFFLLVFGKIALLGFVAFHYSTNGFPPSQAKILFAILTPLLLGFFIVAANGMADLSLSPAAQKIMTLLRWAVYFVIPLYFVLAWWVLYRASLGELSWDFEIARDWLIGIELTFGCLMAWLVKALFLRQ